MEKAQISRPPARSLKCLPVPRKSAPCNFNTDIPLPPDPSKPPSSQISFSTWVPHWLRSPPRMRFLRRSSPPSSFSPAPITTLGHGRKNHDYHNATVQGRAGKLISVRKVSWFSLENFFLKSSAAKQRGDRQSEFMEKFRYCNYCSRSYYGGVILVSTIHVHGSLQSFRQQIPAVFSTLYAAYFASKVATINKC